MKTKWNLMAIVGLISAYYANEYGLWLNIFEADVTYLSSLMLWAMTAWFLALGAGLYLNKSNKVLNIGEILTKRFPQIGLFGTMLGLIMMLSKFNGVDFGDIEAVKTLMGSVSSGMSTALYTTAIGLFCSVITETVLEMIYASKGAE